MTDTHGSYIVAWDFSHGEDGRDVDILLVGKRENGVTNIVNAFQGDEAYDIYKRLSTVKKPE